MPDDSVLPKKSPQGDLTGKQKAFLRSLAHQEKPVVQIGKSGLTDAVFAQTQQALVDHELIKLKVNEREMNVQEIGYQLAEACGAHLVSVKGRVVLLFRRRDRGKAPQIDIKNLKAL